MNNSQPQTQDIELNEEALDEVVGGNRSQLSTAALSLANQSSQATLRLLQ